MNSSRIEIKCSEGDVGLSCVISPGEEEGEYFMDRKIMTSGVGGAADRITMKCEESLTTVIKWLFTELMYINYKELEIKVILNGRRFIEYCWDTGLLNKRDFTEIGLKATLDGVYVIKNRNHPGNATRVRIIPSST